MFTKLHQLLQNEKARFRIIHHPAEGQSARVAQVRGTEVGQGAKAMLCRIKECPEQLVLAILPGDRKIDFRKVAQAIGGRKATLASPADAETLTGCVIGAIPPFTFSPAIQLVVDPELLERYAEIAFNAGSLETSMVLNSEDYRRIARPLMASICSEAPAGTA